MLITVVLAAGAAAVLAIGAQDSRLLRLGLVAALWAALLGAFAVARTRREISSQAARTAVCRLELQHEVAARQELARTVERAQAQQDEISALRTELAALRTNLEKLVGSHSLVAQPARLVAVPAQPDKSSREGSALRFGPHQPVRDADARHGAPSRESARHHGNARHAPPAVAAQRSVNDLLAAHGRGSPPQRRRNRQDGPA